MTDETTQALLPCPFCGGEALRFTLPEDGLGNGGGDVITCTRCQASSHVEFGRKENLVDRWNTRLAHSLPSQADETSGEMRLREALERIANDPYQHGQRIQKMKAIARAALTEGAE